MLWPGVMLKGMSTPAAEGGRGRQWLELDSLAVASSQSVLEKGARRCQNAISSGRLMCICG